MDLKEYIIFMEGISASSRVFDLKPGDTIVVNGDSILEISNIDIRLSRVILLNTPVYRVYADTVKKVSGTILIYSKTEEGEVRARASWSLTDKGEVHIEPSIMINEFELMKLLVSIGDAIQESLSE